MIWIIPLLVLLYLTLTRRWRSKNEPPLDQGLIPWLGHALEFGKDVPRFINRMKQKHGNIFTVRVAGRYVTLLLDPHSYDSVINDSDSLDFSPYAQVLMRRIFNLELPLQQPAKAKAMTTRHFLGMNLSTLNSTMSRHLKSLLKTEMPHNQRNWKEEGLFNLSYGLLFKPDFRPYIFIRADQNAPMMSPVTKEKVDHVKQDLTVYCDVRRSYFRAGYLTLFGGEQNNNKPDPNKVYEEYKKFDGLLCKLARGTLKAEEKKTAQAVQTRLWELLAPAGLTDDSGSGAWLHAYRQLLQEDRVDEETQRKAVLMQLWASQGNVGPAAFWLLGYLLTNPEALVAVKREFGQMSQMEDSGTPLLDRAMNTPVFDSVLEETLRLTAAPFITREVVQDKILCMADGQEYLLRKGDRVCLFPFISPQMDPEIYREPQKFKYDRFMNKDGSVKKDFYKGGKRLKYYTMPWGAGANGCVGKQFAINAIRKFVYMLLTNYDLELCEPNAQMPEINASRYGFGMLQPEGDLLIRYKPRDTQQ